VTILKYNPSSLFWTCL